jgi:hypothetical protein
VSDPALQERGILRVRGEFQVLPPDDPLATFLARPPTPLPVPLPAVPEALTAPATLTSRWADGAAELTVKPPAGVALLPPLALPGPTGRMETAEHLQSVVEQLRGSDPRFHDVQADVIGGTVRLRGVVARAEDGMELAAKIARLPGVERVILREVRSTDSR